MQENRYGILRNIMSALANSRLKDKKLLAIHSGQSSWFLRFTRGPAYETKQPFTLSGKRYKELESSTFFIRPQKVQWEISGSFFNIKSIGKEVLDQNLPSLVWKK